MSFTTSFKAYNQKRKYFCVFGHEIEQQNPVLILNKSYSYFIRLRVFRIRHTDLVNIMTTNELKMI